MQGRVCSVSQGQREEQPWHRGMISWSCFVVPWRGLGRVRTKCPCGGATAASLSWL